MLSLAVNFFQQAVSPSRSFVLKLRILTHIHFSDWNQHVSPVVIMTTILRVFGLPARVLVLVRIRIMLTLSPNQSIQLGQLTSQER